jgi:2-keto-4-pentenoate hydratase/2-oxohepta-3-ene-1,7-dioic acid hydratase in catechol pathway
MHPIQIANCCGHLRLVYGERMTEVPGFNLSNVYDRWDEFLTAVGRIDLANATSEPFDPTQTLAPSPAPRQVFAVAMNYREHAAESGRTAPHEPLFFTKFVSAFSGAHSAVELPPGNVDWECELVVVIGRRARNVDPSRGWDYVAGLTVGNDLSERRLQRSNPIPQLSLAKSHRGFAPQGPVLITTDELESRDDLGIGCELNGEMVQSARTSQMIFPVNDLVVYLSRVLTLYPGDVIFTGTPPGVGMARNPPLFIKPGDVLRTWIEGIGEMRQIFT